MRLSVGVSVCVSVCVAVCLFLWVDGSVCLFVCLCVFVCVCVCVLASVCLLFLETMDREASADFPASWKLRLLT